MEKIITAGDYTFPAKSTAASLFSYKANFKRDGLRDLIRLAKALTPSTPEKADADEGDMLDVTDEFDMDLLFRFLWVFAKAADKSIPPLEEWLEGFEMPPMDFIAEVLPQVTDLLTATSGSTVKSKNSSAAAVKNRK